MNNNNKNIDLNPNLENKYIKLIYKENNEQFMMSEQIKQKYLEMQLKLKLTHGKPSPWLHHYYD